MVLYDFDDFLDKKKKRKERARIVVRRNSDGILEKNMVVNFNLPNYPNYYLFYSYICMSILISIVNLKNMISSLFLVLRHSNQ